MLRVTFRTSKFTEKNKKSNYLSVYYPGEKLINKAMRFSFACFILLRRLVPRRLRNIPPLIQIAPLSKSFPKNSASKQPNEAAIFFVGILFFCCFIPLIILTHIKEIHHRRKKTNTSQSYSLPLSSLISGYLHSPNAKVPALNRQPLRASVGSLR